MGSVCVMVLAGIAGLGAGLAPAWGASADDPPEPTTTIYATDPSPDPPPQPAPSPPPPPPKPTPKPSPPPASTPPPAPAPAEPASQSPAVRQAPAVEKPAAAKPKQKVQRKKVQRKKVVVRETPAAARVGLPEIVLSGTLGVSVGLRNQSPVTSAAAGGDLGSLLIVLSLSFAIACLTVAVIPATSVPWRPAAIFVWDRQLNLTAIGFALLVATSIIFFVTRGA